MSVNLNKEEFVEDTGKQVKVIDKRHFTSDGDRRELQEEEKSSHDLIAESAVPADVDPPAPPAGPSADKRQPPSDESFKEMLLFIAQNALAALGHLQGAPGKKSEVNLEAASTMIEWLGSLEKKTVNNLTLEEKQIMDDYLYQLRMLFYKARQGEKL
jgi:hypothetical protein